MVKRISAFSIVCLFLIISVLPVIGEESRVVDDAGLLTESEITSLRKEIDEIESAYGVQTVILTINDNTVSDSIYYADNYLGIGDNVEGIVLLVDMYNRQVVISTRGNNTISRYRNEWETIRDMITPYLTNQEYNVACELFLELVTNVEETGSTTSYGYRLGNMVKSPIPYGIGLVVALIATVIITLSSKGKVTITNRTYETSDSFRLTHQMDQYLREHTTKRKIETKSSGGSRSSSGGSSRGGGGGGF